MDSTLLVVGLDAVNPELIRRWAAAGELPAVRRLLERGTSGSVTSVEGFFVGSTWPSVYTGLDPAGHGVHRLEQLRPGTYEFHRPLESEDGVGGTPFWRRASEAGRRVAVLDVPLSQPDRNLNGVQVVEWGGHDAVFGFRTAPATLAEEIRSEVGPYPHPSDCDDPGRGGAEEFGAFVEGLEAAVEAKTELTLRLLQREEWDLLTQVFTEGHCAGHQTWHIHDPAHPAHESALREAIGDPVKRVYRALDRAVGRIVEAAGEEARVLLFSAHGMTHWWGASNFLLPELLHELGVTARPSEEVAPPSGPAERLRSWADGAWERLPEGVRRPLRRARDALRGEPARRDPLPTLEADVSGSPCFPVPNGSPVGAIRLNLVGREPRGTLEPGPEAEAFCERLAEQLLAVTDAETGKPLIEAVHRTDDLYDGPRRDALPDLLVEWDRERAVGSAAHAGGRGATIRASSPAAGTVVGTNHYSRTGGHLPGGFFALAGPGIACRRRETPPSVVDLHPTICRLLGLPDPGVDGDPLDDLLPRREPGPGGA